MTTPRYFVTLVCLIGLWTSAFSQQQKVAIQIKNETNINTAGLEFSPIFYEDGIVFISTNTAGAEKFEDEVLKLPAMSILLSRRDTSGNLATPTVFANELVSLYHEGPVSFSPTGDMIYFSRNGLMDGQEVLASDGKLKMRLYASSKNEGGWSAPFDLNLNNGEFDDCHPAMNIDGDKLIFASNRPGGVGGMDLYVSYKLGTLWSEPVNLGPKINTSGNEVFPFLHADNTLYFASNGHGGKGGLDLFQIKLENGDWGTLEPLPAPFNTPEDDFGMIVDLNKINGYFSSSGNFGAGKDDIFSFGLKDGNLDAFVQQNLLPQDSTDKQPIVADKEPIELKDNVLVTVLEKGSNKAVAKADVRILSLDVGDVIGRDDAGNLITVVKEDGQDILKSIPPSAAIAGFSDAKGKFSATVEEGSYSLTVSLPNFQTKQINIKVEKGLNPITVYLERAKDKVQWNASVFNYLTNTPMAGATAVFTTPLGKKDTILTDENGNIQYYLEPNTAYTLDLYQGDRLLGTTKVNSGNGGPSKIQNITVAPLLPNSAIELPNIYYNYNDATLRPDAKKDLDVLLSLLKQHPDVKVELSSHTDSRGTHSYNQDLSQRRADGVVSYLANKGVAKARLIPQGFGETRLRNACTDGANCSEAEHSKNRRTEIKLITGKKVSPTLYMDVEPSKVSDPAPEVVGAPPTKQKEPAKPVTTPGKASVPTKPAPATDLVGGSQAFFVISGSFLQEDYAQKRVQQLKGLGYTNAAIVQFPESPFFAVAIDQFDTREEAKELEERVERTHKLEAFIRRVIK